MKSLECIFIYMILIVCAMTSCSSSQIIKVHGNPGTDIYGNNMQYLGSIPHSGELKVKLDDDVYYPFMLSVSQNDDKIIPFGIDYTYKKRPWATVGKYTGYAITIPSLIGMLAGTTGVIIDSESSAMGALVAAGGGGTLLGVGIGMPSDARSSQLAYKYQYKYVTSQHTNENLHFVRPDIKYIDPTKVKSEKGDGDSMSKQSISSKKAVDWFKNYVIFNDIFDISISNLKTNKEVTLHDLEDASIVFNGDELADSYGIHYGVKLKYTYNDKIYETNFINTKQFAKSGKTIKASVVGVAKQSVVFTPLNGNKQQLEFKDGNIKYLVNFNPKSFKMVPWEAEMEQSILEDLFDESIIDISDILGY